MVAGPLPAGLALLVLLLGHWLLGRLLLRLTAPPAGRLARAMVSLGLGLGIGGPLALLLAGLGLYTVWRWLALLGLIALIALIIRRIRPAQPAATANPVSDAVSVAIPAYIFAALWLLAALYLYFRPHEYVLGAADAGVYVNLGAQIASTGRIDGYDPLVAGLDPALRDGLLRPLDDAPGAAYYLFPAFYVTDPAAGRIVPRFYFLHPAWLAGATALGGVRAALLMTSLWALLAGPAIYLTVAAITGSPPLRGGPRGGTNDQTTPSPPLRGGLRGGSLAQIETNLAPLLTLLLMTFNGLQIWFARYPVTETLTQFWVWLGLWSLIRWLDDDRPGPLWGLLAALAWGNVFLARIDMYPWLAVPAGLALWQVLSGTWTRRRLWFYAPLAALTLLSLLQGYWLSPIYWRELFGYAGLLLRLYWYAPAAALLIGVGAAALIWRRRRSWPRLAAALRQSGWPRAAAAAGIVLLVLYAWFLRPTLAGGVAYVDTYSGQPIPDLDGENLRRLAWYLGPLTIVLAAAGAARLAWRLDQARFVLLGTGLIFAGLYLWRIQANPHQIYAMRRYLPVVTPFAISAGALLLQEINQRRRSLSLPLSLSLSLLWLLTILWFARGFVSQVDHRGLIAQLAAAQAALAPHALLLVDDQAPISQGDIWGTPLHFLFGHDVLTIRRAELRDDPALAAAVDQWQSAGRVVYWVGTEPPPQLGPAQETIPFTVNTTVLETPYAYKPTRLLPYTWSLTVTRLSAP